MSQGTFNKIGKTEKMLFGPRAMLVCGYTPKEQEVFMQFLNTIRIMDVTVSFAATDQKKARLLDLLSQPDQSGRDLPSDMDRTIIVSGITEKELHKTLSSYRDTNLSRPLWATLTPISQNWPLSDLITELKKERAAMEKRKKNRYRR